MKALCETSNIAAIHFIPHLELAYGLPARLFNLEFCRYRRALRRVEKSHQGTVPAYCTVGSQKNKKIVSKEKKQKLKQRDVLLFGLLIQYTGFYDFLLQNRMTAAAGRTQAA